MAAHYIASIGTFIADDPLRIRGCLADRHQHTELLKRQIKAWECEIQVLQSVCKELLKSEPKASNWSLLLEYSIPRRQKRLDAVLLTEDLIFCLEFKTRDKAHSLSARRQVEDYALDLRDFHEYSKCRKIIPIVVVPKAEPVVNSQNGDFADFVKEVKLTNKSDLASIVLTEFQIENNINSTRIDAAAWDKSPYRPTPTIIEAAEILFAGHDVAEIVHSHAGEDNLKVTSVRLVEIVQHAQQHSQKVVCFVTGVPGAGKTLVGLNVAHNPVLRQNGRPAGVFLSGNGPLVKIVSAAIERDFKRRTNKNDGERTVKTFIQNVHTFIREGIEKPDAPPVEKAIIFDEAQRAWNAEQNLKKNDWNVSEPEAILSIMDRHKDWAVLIALVGGGQEINTGEAGLSEWGRALRDGKFQNWKIYISPKAVDGNHNPGFQLFNDGNSGSLTIQKEEALHLKVNHRSLNAPKITEWVDAMLSGNAKNATGIIPKLSGLPIVMTRSLATAREWLKKSARGHTRSGLVASSGALRLRAEGIELSSGFRQGNRDMYVNWFLNLPPDIRSSNQLEVAASEYECQGLELDWVGVCWGNDLCYETSTNGWTYRHLSGSEWRKLNSEIDRQYLLNTYRVLLTRARRGLVVWVPSGDTNDGTREPNSFDSTAKYLTECGLPVI